MPTGFVPHPTVPRDLPSYRDLDRPTPLSLCSSMVIKPESPPAPARNSGRHKPSEASPRRTIEKGHYTQLNAAFTELRDSIPSMRVEAIIWTLVVALIFALQCRPLSVAWGVGTGTCLSTAFIGNTGIALSVMGMVTSWSPIATIVRLKFVIEVAQMPSKGGLATADLIQTTLEATIYSIIEIDLSIVAASLTALRPLLKRVPCFSDISSGGYSGSRGFTINTFGQGSSRANRPSYRLDDRTASDVGSRENIVPAKPGNIRKQIYIESTSSCRGPATTDRPIREHW
ncbi:hypothetical protein EDB80DRAFT_900207 [Ilyonectria destructans]|nr:hypothetical protein EDB80DRAFT_900207 [Ilyonectria destructans]